MSAPIEWQCTCGAWLPVGFSRHSHMVGRSSNTLEELLAMRAATEAGIAGAVHLKDEAEFEYVLRTKDMPTR